MRRRIVLCMILGTVVSVAAWAGTTAIATLATGRVASVDDSGRRVPIDAATTTVGPNAIVPATDRNSPRQPAAPRRLLGAWLLAMTGTTVVLRARRRRTI
jgi:hypothetical protein